MNALDLLKEDHETVQDLFAQIRQADDITEKREVFALIRDELTTHMMIEESIFYPAFQPFSEFDDLLDESYDDHQEVKDLLEEMESDDESEFEDQIDELIQNVEHHVEQEENEFFPRALRVMDEARLNQLGTLLENAKQDKASAA